MAEIELRRFYEYARLAINNESLLSQLDDLASDYGLTTEDFVTFELFGNQTIIAPIDL